MIEFVLGERLNTKNPSKYAPKVQSNPRSFMKEYASSCNNHFIESIIKGLN